MKDTTLFSWDIGTIVIVAGFGLVTLGIISLIFVMMNSDRKKK